MKSRREKEADLIVIAAAEEYGYKKNMAVSDVLQLFQKENIFNLLRSQYEVLHTMDLSEGTEFVESYLKRAVL